MNGISEKYTPRRCRRNQSNSMHRRTARGGAQSALALSTSLPSQMCRLFRDGSLQTLFPRLVLERASRDVSRTRPFPCDRMCINDRGSSTKGRKERRTCSSLKTYASEINKLSIECVIRRRNQSYLIRLLYSCEPLSRCLNVVIVLVRVVFESKLSERALGCFANGLSDRLFR